MKVTNRQRHDIEQGSQQWLDLRNGYCTASQAPNVMGCGYAKTDTSSDFVQAMFAAGHEAEAAIRPTIEADLFGFRGLTNPTFTCEVEGLRLLASLDGWDETDGVIWECKHTDLKKPSAKAIEVVQEGKAPDTWYWQIQHQMIVTGASKAILTVTDGTDHHSITVKANIDDQQKLIAAWKIHTDWETEELANSYAIIDDQIKKLKQEQEDIKAQLTAKAGTTGLKVGRVSVSVSETWEKKQTAADYVKTNGIELVATRLDQPEYRYTVRVN